MFEAERPSLVAYAGRFDGFHAVMASVSKTCLVRFDGNQIFRRGRPVEVRAYAERIELRQAGRIVGEHPRCFGRDQTVFDPWPYVPMLACAGESTGKSLGASPARRPRITAPDRPPYHPDQRQ